MTLTVQEALGFAPFGRPSFRADLGQLAASVRTDAQRWAEQAVLIERLASQVPPERGSTRDATAWKSFVREIAVAKRCSDQAAAKEVFLSVALVRSHPRTLSLLQSASCPSTTLGSWSKRARRASPMSRRRSMPSWLTAPAG